jgi:hypothetical protein
MGGLLCSHHAQPRTKFLAHASTLTRQELDATKQFQQLGRANLAPKDGPAVIIDAMNLEDSLRYPGRRC